ncbi:MAG: hypothetical protein CMH48_10200 [Muricauda sp.]|nr:hypothetical protein [Allomuricauda sp.]MAU26689.1 hypothetical protein [Allomuricauda sp.]MBC31204.1 hypothetical protein [Allomuricauda sp.]|tara:strand:+ start:873 stop:1052 length:180 start_codon:yes stop_codon:yes gene_type:complete
MITFFSILFILLAINALLLIFSVNGAKDMFKKPLRKISDTSIAKVLPREYSESDYKKAV